MSAVVLPDWMTGTAETIERAFSHADSTQTPNREPASILFLASVLRRAIRIVRNELNEGLEASLLVAQHASTSGALEHIQKSLRDVAATIPNQFRGHVARRLLARMRRIENDVVETQEFLAKCLDAARAPRPPLDVESIRRGRSDVAAGRVEDSQVICNRIRSGGDN
jgi:hypothetical protein